MTELQWLETNLLSLSPEMTAALVSRVYAVALQAILWGSLFFLAGVYFSTLATRVFRRSKAEFEDSGFAWVIAAVVAFIVSAALLAMAVGRLNSPEYYILQYIKNGLFGG